MCHQGELRGKLFSTKRKPSLMFWKDVHLCQKSIFVSEHNGTVYRGCLQIRPLQISWVLPIRPSPFEQKHMVEQNCSPPSWADPERKKESHDLSQGHTPNNLKISQLLKGPTTSH